VIAPAELVRALNRDHVGGFLDDADQRKVTPLICADPANRTLRAVEARLAQADLLLYLRDRICQRERLVLARPQQMARQALRGPPADPGQL